VLPADSSESEDSRPSTASSFSTLGSRPGSSRAGSRPGSSKETLTHKASSMLASILNADSPALLRRDGGPDGDAPTTIVEEPSFASSHKSSEERGAFSRQHGRAFPPLLTAGHRRGVPVHVVA
jgi:hypothetical protein